MAFGLQKVFSKDNGKMVESWVFDAKSPLVCGASVVEHEGKAFVVIGTKSGAVLCLDEHGKLIWSYGAHEKLGDVESYFVDEERLHSIDAAPLIADVNLDGRPEIVVGTERGVIYCLDLGGKLLWSHDTGGAIKAGGLIADINMDGKPEIVFGSMNNRVTVLSGSGKVQFQHTTSAPVESVPGLLKGKRLLLVFGDNGGTLTAITPAQEVAWRADLKVKITAAPAIYFDEEIRIVIGTHDGTLYCLNENGAMLWQFRTQGTIYSAASVHDINDDHRPEIIFGSCDNKVYALTGSGKRLWSYETDFWVTATPVISDVDNDGKVEIIAGSFDHNVYVLDSMGTFILDYVPGLSGIVNQAGHYSNILTSDPGQQTGKMRYSFGTGGIVVGCSVLQRRNAKPALIVNIKSGQVDNLRHE
jgi:outer membrane protein assembly factor BamB